MQSPENRMKNHLLCCDWGTSSFRLQLMNITTHVCTGEVRADTGISAMFDDWKSAAREQGLSREDFFRQVLQKHISRLETQLSVTLTDVPVMVSGMASSSIGMAEVPYATLPFPTDGSHASIQRFESNPDFRHDLFLISGVRSEQDVMRGEETQLIGLMKLLALSGHTSQDALCIFPGTHSKHLYIQHEKLIHFDTYMTGEIFDVMRRHSILKDSVDYFAYADLPDTAIKAFQKGVHQSISSNILNTLFSVRTNQLFDKISKEENSFYLSGLLIGTELNQLQSTSEAPLILCGGSNLSSLYELAISELQLAHRTYTAPADLVDRAASMGQLLLFQYQLIKQPTE
ncbi:2-dehydro-3-deoxygalactonokinase [Spirosoma spitsbergense]|uniref:2-dehydro-3-deoxygalactonokinase n=1 Tax=Spirosoma spitsbergense TaxID=431554 RepID=UPI0003666FD3|nr:2-dehydro-3-deoxygalactonokinase [Spirosoma spitsbergense]